jgi:oligosaccharide repeat unit polymerase
MIFVLVLGTLLWLAMIAFYARSGVASTFHPATYYLFFQGFVFMVRPWLNWYYSYSYVYEAYRFRPWESDRVTALLAADLGFITFMFFVLRAGAAPLVIKPVPEQRSVLHRRYRRSMLIAILLCAPLGLYSLYKGLHTGLEGSSTMLMDKSSGILVNTSGNGYMADANNMLIPIVVLIPWLYRFRLWSLLPFLAFSFTRMINGGGRWTFVMAAASLALAYLYERRARWFNLQALGLGITIIFLFNALGHNRAAIKSLVMGERNATLTTDSGLYPLEDMNYANQEFLEYLVKVIPDQTRTYDYFLDNLQVFTEPVPRVLWPGKPIGAPIQLYSLWDYGTPIGMTYSLPGEGWAQWGYLGVIIWCGLFGWVFGRFYNWFARSAQTEFQVATYILLLPLSIQFFRDGTLLTMMKFPLFYIIPLLIWWMIAWYNGRRVRPNRQRRPVLRRPLPQRTSS